MLECNSSIADGTGHWLLLCCHQEKQPLFSSWVFLSFWRNWPEDNEYFIETQFEVGVMPDPSFWIAMHQNNFILLDKNPPQISAVDNSIKD